MLTEDEIKDIEGLSLKHQSVAKLFFFWNESQKDGFAAAKMAINRKWLDLSKDIETSDITIRGDDRIYESFLKTTKLFEDIDKAKHKAETDKIEKKGKKTGHEGKAVI
jgi:hypothetical protein